MKLISMIILCWIVMQTVAQSEEDAQTDASSKSLPSQQKAITVQPFNLDELGTIQQQGYERHGGSHVKGVTNGKIWTQEYCVINRDISQQDRSGLNVV